MPKVQEACLVLFPEEPREKFERVATQLGFVHVETRPGDGDRVAYEQVWSTPDKLNAANYLEDPMVNFNYVSLRSLTSVRRIQTEFAKRLGCIPGEELLENAVQATEHDEQVRAINRLAVKFVDYHPTAFALIEAYATQPPNPLLRKAAVNAMAIRAWPQFRPLLERIAKDDPDESVREHAQAILPYVPAASGGTS